MFDTKSVEDGDSRNIDKIFTEVVENEILVDGVGNVAENDLNVGNDNLILILNRQNCVQLVQVILSPSQTI